jgi:hypothetical protein
MTRGKKAKRSQAASREDVAALVAKNVLSERAALTFVPSEFLAASIELLEKYLEARALSDNEKKSLRGYVFQRLVAESLRIAGIDPIHTEAFVTFVPIAKYDIIVPTKLEGIVNLSVKTTLRERWKQAEFEGIALKRVHRRSRIYVVSKDADETRKRRAQIDQCEAIDDFIDCTSADFDALVAAILSWEPTSLPPVPVISPDGRRHPIDAMLCDQGYSQRRRIDFGKSGKAP